MNGLINLAWTVMCIAATAFCLVTLIADRAEIGSRLRQGTRLLAETVPWLVAVVLTRARRGRSPSRAHPAARAVSQTASIFTARPLDDMPRARAMEDGNWVLDCIRCGGPHQVIDVTGALDEARALAYPCQRCGVLAFYKIGPGEDLGDFDSFERAYRETAEPGTGEAS